MIHYSIQIIVFQLLFIAIYDVFLKRETFFNYNRAYLIITNVLSLVLPFIRIERLQEVIPQEYVIALPELLLNNAAQDLSQTSAGLNLQTSFLSYILYVGMLCTFILFLFKIINLIKIIYKNPKLKTKAATIVTVLNTNTAFSFFRYVFIGDRLSSEDKENILAHEKVHVKEKHSLDMLLFEIQRIIFWFNPLVYVYQNRISTLHEFIADDEVVKTSSKKEYYENLLQEVFSVKRISFINTFFKTSLIKKRIIMLSKSKSKQQNLVKYALLIPAVVGMLFYSACSQQNDGAKKEDILNSGTTTRTEVQVVTPESQDNLGEEVAFAVIENVPIFPGCENTENQKKCFSDRLSKLVAQNFNTKLADDLGLTGVQKISVFFKVSEDGTIKEIKARAPHPALEEEGKRIIRELPKMEPGTHQGKAVTVPYYLPIKFQIKG